MTRPDELDSRIASWVNDLPEHAPEGILEPVLAELPRLSQQGGLRAVLGRAVMRPSLGRPTRSLLPIAFTGVVVLVVGLGLYLAQNSRSPAVGGESTPSPSPAASSLRPSILEVEQFGPGGPDRELQAIGFGAIFATNAYRGVTKMDLATGMGVEFDGDVAPQAPVSDRAPLALGGESLWLGARVGKSLMRLSPENGASDFSIPLDFVPYDIALDVEAPATLPGVGHDRAWVTDIDAGLIALVDLDSGEVLWRTEFPEAAGVAVVDHAGWVVSSTGLLWRINPDDGSMRIDVQIPPGLTSILADGETAWLWGDASAPLTRVDTRTGDVRSAPADGPRGVTGVAVTGGKVWVAFGPSTIASIDRETLRLTSSSDLPTTVPPSTSTGALLADDGLLWLGTHETGRLAIGGESIWRIRPAP